MPQTTERTEPPPVEPGSATPPPLAFNLVIWVSVFSVVLYVMMRWFGRVSGRSDDDQPG